MINKIGQFSFYIFLIVFILVAYLYNRGLLSNFFKSPTAIFKNLQKKNVVEIDFVKKEYKIDVPKKFDNWTVELGDFENNEQWEGEYKLNKSIFALGTSSIAISSQNHHSVVLSLKKQANLTDKKNIRMFIYNEDQKNANGIEKLSLRLGKNDDSSYYEYVLTNIASGWNLVNMAEENFNFVSKNARFSETSTSSSTNNPGELWSSIEKVSFFLQSRPNTQVDLLLDRLWAEKDEEYQNDFRGHNESLISTKNYKGKNYINFWPFNSTTAYIKEITSAKDFAYTAKIVPQQKGSFGIITRTDQSNAFGYYLVLNGIDSNGWRLYKQGKLNADNSMTEMDSGEIANYTISENVPIWLRLQTLGDKISAFLSLDGDHFTKLTTKSDKELKSGGIGLLVNPNASFLLELIDFHQ